MKDSLSRLEVARLLKRKPALVTPVFIYKAVPSLVGDTRIAFAFSRRAGPAVKRNLFRRRLREYVRQNRETLSKQDILCIAKGSLASLTRVEWQRELASLAKWLTRTRE